MYALVVLALGVDNLHGFIFRDEHAGVAHLTAHLAIEGRIVEHELIEGMLLLLHLAVAQDVAFVFGIIVADEVLLAWAQFGPVAVLHGGSVAGTLLLLLHFLVEALHVNGVAVLAADEFCEVERESVGIEKAEG